MAGASLCRDTIAVGWTGDGEGVLEIFSPTPSFFIWGNWGLRRSQMELEAYFDVSSPSQMSVLYDV